MFVDSSTRDVTGAYNLKRLFVFRSAVIASEVVAIGLAVYLLDVHLPLTAMFSVIAVYGLFNLLLWWRIRHDASGSANEFFLTLVLDVVALAALLYFAGGSSNPFVSLFLLPLVIIAATLPKRYVWAMAVVTLSCYTLLMLMNVPLTQQMTGHGSHMSHSAHGSDFGLHVLGMWFSFLVAVGLILFFVVSMAEALRQRDQKLAEAREKNLRDEHMVALGTMAAGAAHELGTPLATMAVLTKEMEQEYSEKPDLVEKLEIMRSQVDRCKATLRQISASAGQMKADSGHSEDVRACLNHCIERWHELHPQTDITTDLQGIDPAPLIVVDETLNQAVLNLLNNAAEASPERIDLSATWTHDEMRLVVRDFGAGFSPQVLKELGTPFFTTKSGGHGLGFYLAGEVVRRLGGDVSADNHPEGGALVSIRLPLQKLMTE